MCEVQAQCAFILCCLILCIWTLVRSMVSESPSIITQYLASVSQLYL